MLYLEQKYIFITHKKLTNISLLYNSLKIYIHIFLIAQNTQ